MAHVLPPKLPRLELTMVLSLTARLKMEMITHLFLHLPQQTTGLSSSGSLSLSPSKSNLADAANLVQIFDLYEGWPSTFHKCPLVSYQMLWSIWINHQWVYQRNCHIYVH